MNETNNEVIENVDKMHLAWGEGDVYRYQRYGFSLVGVLRHHECGGFVAEVWQGDVKLFRIAIMKDSIYFAKGVLKGSLFQATIDLSSNRRKKIVRRLAAASDQQPADSDQQPADSDQQPAVSSQQPTVGRDVPVTPSSAATLAEAAI